jgi:transcriptional regulator GlxA family with amidase domain
LFPQWATRRITQLSRISRAIHSIRSRYEQPIRVEELAQITGMSAPSFHRHFRAVTSMSPLQFQKRIRLQEARRILLSQNTDAARAGFEVGYESASQFSREYRRLFGAPPGQDSARLRENLTRRNTRSNALKRSQWHDACALAKDLTPDCRTRLSAQDGRERCRNWATQL